METCSFNRNENETRKKNTNVERSKCKNEKRELCTMIANSSTYRIDRKSENRNRLNAYTHLRKYCTVYFTTLTLTHRQSVNRGLLHSVPANAIRSTFFRFVFTMCAMCSRVNRQ